MKYIVLILIILIFTISCNTNYKKTNTRKLTTIINTNSIGHQLFNQKCMICHETKGKNAETMLAPPFYEVKKRYMKISMNKDDFIETMRVWIKNPTVDNSFMDEAIKDLGIMPKLNYSEHDIEIIVNYIYKTDFQEPNWLKEHTKKHENNVKHIH